MKKILATVLLASVSMGVMASPAGCMLNWAKSQGIDVTKEHAIVPSWGPQGRFSWNKQGPTDGYKLEISNDAGLVKEVRKGPWSCHCTTLTIPAPPHQPGHPNYIPVVVTGVCGVW